MSIEDLPDLKKKQYPERLTICVSSETKRRLDSLKTKHGKDTAALLRRVIDDAIKDVAV